MPANIAHMVIVHKAFERLRTRGFDELATFARMIDDGQVGAGAAQGEPAIPQCRHSMGNSEALVQAMGNVHHPDGAGGELSDRVQHEGRLVRFQGRSGLVEDGESRTAQNIGHGRPQAERDQHLFAAG